MIVNDLKNMDMYPKIDKRYYVAYLRKSSESEDRQVQSIEDQRKVILPLAQEKNLEILEVFEEAKSAKAPGRPEFNRMVQSIRDRSDIKGILCWKLNRLSRNPVDTGALQWLLQERQIEEIVTPSKTYVEADSDFIMAVEGAQANRFIRDLKEDTWRGMKSKIEKGLAPLLAVPGYKNDKTKDQGKRDIIVDPVQFPLMRKLFDMALSGDYSILDLYDKAKEMGIKTNRGKEISHTRIAELLKCLFYTGKFVYAGQIYDGVHKPMISMEEYQLIQEIFTRRNRQRDSVHQHPYPDGLIRCVCGRSLIYEPKVKHYKNGKIQAFVYLRCNRHRYQPSDLCPRSAINIEDLHPQIIKRLGEVRISPDLVMWGIKRLNEKNDFKRKVREAEVTSIQKSYDEVQVRMENLLKLKLSPLNSTGTLLTDVEYAEQRVELLKEKNKFYDRLNKVDKEREDWADLAVATFNFAARAQEAYAKGDLETRRDICRIFGNQLVLNGKKLEIRFRDPFTFIKTAADKSELNKMPSSSPVVPLQASSQTLGVVYGSRTR